MNKTKIIELVMCLAFICSCSNTCGSANCNCETNSKQVDEREAMTSYTIRNCINPSEDDSYDISYAPYILNDENSLCLGIETSALSPYYSQVSMSIAVGFVASYYNGEAPKVYKTSDKTGDYFTRRDLEQGSFSLVMSTAFRDQTNEMKIGDDFNFVSYDYTAKIENNRYLVPRFADINVPLDYFLSGKYNVPNILTFSVVFKPKIQVNEFELYPVTFATLKYEKLSYGVYFYSEYKPEKIERNKDDRLWNWNFID